MLQPAASSLRAAETAHRSTGRHDRTPGHPNECIPVVGTSRPQVVAQPVAREALPHGSRNIGRIGKTVFAIAASVPSVFCVLQKQRLDDRLPLPVRISLVHPRRTGSLPRPAALLGRGIGAECTAPGITHTPCGPDTDGPVPVGMNNQQWNGSLSVTHFVIHCRDDLSRRFESWARHTDGQRAFRVRQSGNLSAGGDLVAAGNEQRDGHAGTGGQTGNMKSIRIRAEANRHRTENLPEILDFANAGSRLAGEPESPAVSEARARIATDEWINDSETVLVGEPVEIGDVPNVMVILVTAMQDHHHRQAHATAIGWRQMHQVTALS